MLIEARLASAFLAHLREDVGDSWPEMIAKQPALAGTGVCASHDYIDANMTMAAAWEELGLPDLDADNETQAALWSAAWGIAHATMVAEA